MKIIKLSRCVKAPMRVLCRARDFYVRSMNNYAGRMPSTLPKSFSVNSARPNLGEDLPMLIRVVSKRRQREKAETLQQATYSRGSNGRLPKSFSVGMGRIDEDKPCDFAEDFRLNSAAVLYPRSQSYAVVNGKTRLQSY